MLLEFTVGNYLSFKEKKTLNLAAASVREHRESNLVDTGRLSLLKGAVIYGANASGKSNLVKAMSTMRRLVLQFEKSSAAELDITPFLLQAGMEDEPSFFEVLFFVEDIRYRYGFEVNNVAVKAEWLFESRKQAEKPLFVREEEGIDVMKQFAEGKDLEEKTRPNALFLSVVDQFNGATAKKIMTWFNNFVTISGLAHERYTHITYAMLEDEETKPLLQAFFNNADLGFDAVKLDRSDFDISKLPRGLPEAVMKELSLTLKEQKMMEISTVHKKFNQKHEVVGTVEFSMDSQESSGTRKLFNMSGPVFDVLHDGGMLVVDELDASMHPLLTLAVTRLFNSVVHNPRNAQLIFSTHDTNLLSYGEYRRDQIYFVEKDAYGASDLYSLVEYKEKGAGAVRKDRSFEKDYIQGRYGAIPFIGKLSIDNLSNEPGEWPEK